MSNPEIIYEVGEGNPIVVINTGTHGNEYQPVEAANQFAENFDGSELVTGTVRLIVSNPPALEQNKRFLDEDLNRAFPGDPSSPSREARLASQVLGLVDDADFVVDLHTAPDGPPFTILGSRDRSRLDLAELAPVQDIVLFEATEPCAMVDFTKCGIGIEIGAHTDEQSTQEGVSIIEAYLERLGLTPSTLTGGRKYAYSRRGLGDLFPHQYHEVFSRLTRADIPEDAIAQLKNLEPIDSATLGLNLEEPVVHPVLCGDKDYSPVFCYLAKPVDRESLGGRKRYNAYF